MNYKSTRIRAQKVVERLQEHYEPGRNDRCKAQVWRSTLSREFGVSRRTVSRYERLVQRRGQEQPAEEDERELKLF